MNVMRKESKVHLLLTQTTDFAKRLHLLKWLWRVEVEQGNEVLALPFSFACACSHTNDATGGPDDKS